MPIGWKPRSSKLEQLIQAEEAQIEKLKNPIWTPPIANRSILPQVTAPQFTMPQLAAPTIEEPVTEQPVKREYDYDRTSLITNLPRPPNPPIDEEAELTPLQQEITRPWWERALDAFQAPFKWVDENIIRPGYGIIADPLIPDVKRKTGENFFDWKRRSWEEWKDPHITLNTPWGERKIGLKGLAEFAPWLLVPGANTIGGTMRGLGSVGFGASLKALGGAIGSLDYVNTIRIAAGTAIKYSPWGLMEATTSKVMTGFMKGASHIYNRVLPPTPKTPPPPVVQRFNENLRKVIMPLREKFERELPEFRQKQAGILSDYQAKFRTGQITAAEYDELASGAVKALGGLKPEFAIPAGTFSPEDASELMGMIVAAAEKSFVTHDALHAFNLMATEGFLPQPHHIRQFANIFGSETSRIISTFKSMTPTFREKLIDFLNMPRAVLASGDLSATARQGMILGATHPTLVPQAFKRQVRAFFSEKNALQIDDIIRSDPLFPEWIERGGYHGALEKAGFAPQAWEETFSSQIADKLPFVRNSERAFNTYLNSLRFGVYKEIGQVWKGLGAGTEDMTLLADFINKASGRGKLHFVLDKYSPILNTFLFSPKLQASRLQLPATLGKMLTSDNYFVKKEAARALAVFVGGGATLLGLLELSGVGKVEINPLAGDFGKLKIGDTRLDIWTGYVQYIRFAAQMAMGATTTAYGNTNKKNRMEIALRFLQTKTSPLAGFMFDIFRGEDYQGEPIFKDTAGTLDLARNRFIPLWAQDVIDAVEQGGWNGAFYAAPAFFGIGALTYVDELVRAREKAARQIGAESWKALDPKTQRELEEASLDLQKAMLTFDRKVMDTAWGEWRIVGNTVESNFKDAVNMSVAKYRANLDGVAFRDDITKAYAERRGAYKVREADPRFAEIVARQNLPSTIESLGKLGDEQLAIKIYNDALYGENMYDEFGDYKFDEAEVIKQRLVATLGQPTIDYIEEYQGMRYEDLPPEYHELMKAKKIMKPYWAIKDDVIRLFGAAFAESSRGKALITKRRQELRARSPDIARVYALFYQN